MIIRARALLVHKFSDFFDQAPSFFNLEQYMHRWKMHVHACWSDRINAQPLFS